MSGNLEQGGGLTRRDFDKAAFLTTLVLPGALSSLSCNPAPQTQELPFRSKEDAIRATQISRTMHGFFQRREGRSETDIESVLKTSHFESPVGFVNGLLYEPEEELDLPSQVNFAIKPWDFIFEHNHQLVSAFANSLDGLEFRTGGSAEALTRMFDRTVWMANSGGKVTAILETDLASDKQIEDITELLAYYGIVNIIVANEPNSREATWLDKPEVIFRQCKVVKETHESLGIQDGQTSSPGFAHFGDGEDEDRYLKVWHKLGNGRLPIDRFAVHIYGSPEGVLRRGRMLRRVINSAGGSGLKLDCTELGSPNFPVPLGDVEYTLGSLSPKLILALASGLFDSVDLYSLLDENPMHSLADIQGHRLVPKVSYVAAKNIGKVFARVTEKSLDEGNPNYFQIDFRRSDGIEGAIYISRINREFSLTKGRDDLLFDVLGNRIDEAGVFFLPAKQRDDLSGAPRIVIRR